MDRWQIEHKRSRPGDILLDLLRGSRIHGRSVRTLLLWGKMFGINDNQLRVTLSRLSNRGLVESPERGRYRLTSQADSVNQFVDRWRLGEGRVRSWSAGEWLLVYLPGQMGSEQWAMQALGFRAVLAGLFARPDNLNMSQKQLKETASALRCPDHVIWLDAKSHVALPQDWWACWQIDRLEERYRGLIGVLSESSRRLEKLDAREAHLETFYLGGEAINLLAKDPMLPDEMVDTELRRQLWQILMEYDAQGRIIWSRGEVGSAAEMPTSSSLVVPVN